MSDRVPVAIEELHAAETELARDLLQLAERHHAEHEVHHVAIDLAGWSRIHVRELAAAGAEHGLDLDPEVAGPGGPVAALMEKGSDLLGRRHETGVVLLRDLRDIHRQAAAASLDWDVLGNTAQSLRDEDLLALTQRSHPQTLRQMRWADAMVKEVAAQVLVV